MQLNQTVRAYDLAEALRGESGKFEVVTSEGTRLIVTAVPGHSIANLRIANEAWLRASGIDLLGATESEDYKYFCDQALKRNQLDQ